jgi:hypothetical protein
MYKNTQICQKKIIIIIIIIIIIDYSHPQNIVIIRICEATINVPNNLCSQEYKGKEKQLNF